MFDNVSFALASAVANNGTVTVGYPDGRSQGHYDWTPGKHKLTVGSNFYEAPADFTLTFNANASSITLTNKSGSSWPAGSACTVQLDRPGADNREEVVPSDSDRVRQLEAGLYLINLGSPNVADADGFFASQDLTTAGVASSSTTVAAAIAAAALAGVADVPRNVVAAWTGTAVLTVTGLDEFGETVVESSASGTSFTGSKAFKEVTGIAVSANVTSLTVGTGDKLGLPVALGKAGQIIAEFLDGVRVSAGTQKYTVPFVIGATELSAGTSTELACPVAGRVSKLTTIVQTAIVTGGAVTAQVATTDIDGLSITVADSATKGTVQSDTPTAGHASSIVAVGDRLQVTPAAAFNGGGALAGFLEIETMSGDLVVASTAEATATTGDVRGTYDPLAACNGDKGYMLLVALPNPDDRGVAQYAG